MKPNSSPPASRAPNLRLAILTLGAVSAVDMLLQVLLPMVLVRLLVATDFGVYRQVWLIAATALSLLPMAIPTSLYYFLPRHDGARKAVYLTQAAWFMTGAGLLAAAACWAWVGGNRLPSAQQLPIVVFVGLWVFASLLDGLFNAQQRNSRQAGVNAVFAVVRFGSVALVALFTRSLAAVLFAQVALAALKAAVCVVELRRSVAAIVGPSTRSPWWHWQRASWLEQLHFAAPFGISSGLYLLRGRIDQWLVAAVFAPALFGLYSVAAVFLPIQGQIRSTINNVVLPELTRLQAEGDMARMIELSQRGNLAVALVVFPVLAYLSAAATPLLALMFTHDYTGAAPVVRVYALTLLIESMEVTMILTAFRQGRYLMVLDATVLVVSIAISAAGAWAFGLAGAALGGTVSAAMAQTVCYRRCAHLAGRPAGVLQPWGPIVRVLSAAGAAGGVAALGVWHCAQQPAWVLLLVSAPGFVILYWVGLRALGMAPMVRQVFGPKIAAVLLL